MSGPNGTWSGRVEWVDTDAAGIHHNTAVARYVESAEAALMRDLGLVDYFPVAPRVRYEVDFDAPLRFGDAVVATVRVQHVGKTSLTNAFEVWGGRSDETAVRVARGRYVTVHLDVVTGRASAWPDRWRELLTSPGNR